MTFLQNMLDSLEGGIDTDLEKTPSHGYQNTGHHNAVANGKLNDTFRYLKGFMNDYIISTYSQLELSR